MLKNVRNWLFHSNIADFTSPDPKKAKRNFRLLAHKEGIICKEHVKNMLKVEPPSEFTNHNLQQSDVDVHGFGVMHVGPAAHVINGRVAAALRSWNDPTTRPRAYAARKHENEGLMDGTIKFLEVFSDLFHNFFMNVNLRLWSMHDDAWKHLDRAETYGTFFLCMSHSSSRCDHMCRVCVLNIA
jgi:hypothetical protein